MENWDYLLGGTRTRMTATIHAMRTMRKPAAKFPVLTSVNPPAQHYDRRTLNSTEHFIYD